MLCNTKYYIRLQGIYQATIPKGNKMILDTPQKIEAFRLRSLRQGLKLEMIGMRLTSKGKTCYAILKGMGYKGTKQQVFDQITIDSENALAEAINS
jgi:hypothetical protein